jgi:hypothetical protein
MLTLGMSIRPAARTALTDDGKVKGVMGAKGSLRWHNARALQEELIQEKFPPQKGIMAIIKKETNTFLQMKRFKPNNITWATDGSMDPAVFPELRRTASAVCCKNQRQVCKHHASGDHSDDHIYPY